MNMTELLMSRLAASKTPFHAVELAAKELEEQGYIRLFEEENWEIARGGRYFTVRDGSALIAFSVGKESGGFRIVASHTDSPNLAVKGNPLTYVGGAARLNVEVYGGPLLYSWLDIPLALAGRVVVCDKNTRKIVSRNFVGIYFAFVSI